MSDSSQRTLRTTSDTGGPKHLCRHEEGWAGSRLGRRCVQNLNKEQSHSTAPHPAHMLASSPLPSWQKTRGYYMERLNKKSSAGRHQADRSMALRENKGIKGKSTN